MDERDLTKVADAFDRLLSFTARNCEAQQSWAIAAAKDDVLDILAGAWHADEPDYVESADTADILAV
jgi:hypothetical protein